MTLYARPIQILIDELGRLPGVGPKSAQRMAFHLLNVDAVDAQRLADAIITMKREITFCERCFNVAQGALCEICADDRRDETTLCVVEEPKDITAVERTGAFSGRYHVLGGCINILEGVGPEQLRLRELAARVHTEDVAEVILCMNPTIEGETTASYIATKVLDRSTTKVTRLASGLPVGGDLEYADELTLGRAFEGRHQF